MSDLAPTISRIPVPGRSLWWLVGAAVLGIAIPVAIGTTTALAAYYPVGSFLPRTFLFSFIGTLSLIGLSAVLGVMVGIGYSLAAWNWRPFILSIIVFGAILPGVYPGIVTHLYLRKVAFELLADRSMSVVEAIRRCERDTGSPPATLADLVPRYLPSVPGTGMSKYPHYDYARASDTCPVGNDWGITMFVGDGLAFDIFYYCPLQNYPSRNSTRIIGEWAYFQD
jgi:MFS family permease